MDIGNLSEIRIAELETQLRLREHEVALLRDTALAIGSELDLDTVLNLIAVRAQEVIQAETVLLPILNRECTDYTYRAGVGMYADEIIGASLPIEFGVCGWVWKNRKPWWHGVLSQLSENERNAWEKEAGTLILVPLIGRKHFLGGIAGMNKKGGGEFSRNDLHMLELFATQAAIAIENAMAMELVEQSRQAAEEAQSELQRVNKRLSAVNHELEFLSLYDPLTSLPNRTLFRERFRHELEHGAETNGHFALVIVDIDRFQEINDDLGHDAGDDLLQLTAAKIHSLAGSENVVARLSGDEFAILIKADQVNAMEIAEKISALLCQPAKIANQEMVVTSSMGVALYPQHGSDIYSLFKHADEAVLAAKRDKARICVYDEHLNVKSTARLPMLQELHKALRDREFELHYQPKIDLVLNQVDGVEALARWQRDKGVMVPPDMFIDALEQTGLIAAFTYWALGEAAAQRKCWLAAGMDIRIAVNMPLSVVMDSHFLTELGQIFGAHGDASGLVLEITENIFLGDYMRINNVLTEARKFGFVFSIDDFGTGHSSLARLRQMPVDEIKIDKSFVMTMLDNKDDEVIVRSTIELGHNLGLKVVAEGVENARIMKALARLRCDVVQGYYVSRPLAAAQLERFLAKGKWTVLAGSDQQPAQHAE